MRVDPQVKSAAESIFASLGMTLSEAFDVRQPRYNAETEAAIREACAIVDGKVPAESFDSAATMFAALDE